MHLFTSAYFSLQTSFFKLALWLTLENLRLSVRYWKVRAGDRRRRSSVTLDFDAIQIYAKPAEMQKINCSCKMSCDRIFMIKWRNILLGDDLIIGRLSSGTLMQKN